METTILQYRMVYSPRNDNSKCHYSNYFQGQGGTILDRIVAGGLGGFGAKIQYTPTHTKSSSLEPHIPETSYPRNTYLLRASTEQNGITTLYHQ